MGLSLPPPRKRASSRAPPWLALALVLGAGLPSLPAAVMTEHQIKALFVLNFTRFVLWPPSTFTATDAPIVIGVLGENSFGPLLQEAVKDERVRTHPIVVKELGPSDDPAHCHLLFISRSESERARRLLRTLGSAPVLTVSDLDRFCEDGGMIALVTQGDAVRFEINARAAAAAGLQVSAKLLSLAKPAAPAPPPSPPR